MKFSLPFLLFLLPLGFVACGDDDNDLPELEIPGSYSTFENVDYSGQTSRLNQLSEIKAYIATANAGAELDNDRLQAMYANADGAMFSQEYDKQLRDKTFDPEVAVFESLFANIAEQSKSNQAGTPGTAGVVVSDDGEKSYLLNENGVELVQLIEKGLMGAVFYYQGTSVYLGTDRQNADNETVEPGRGTDLEHHWDESFGYFGVPLNFPADTDGVRFWGDYANDRNALLGVNQKIMSDGFLKGRAAASADRNAEREEAIETVREQWELVSAATAIHYLNSGESNFGDRARQNHALSEAVAFIYSLKFNEGRTASISDIDGMLITLAGSSTLLGANLDNTTLANIATVRDQLATLFDLEDVKSEL